MLRGIYQESYVVGVPQSVKVHTIHFDSSCSDIYSLSHHFSSLQTDEHRWKEASLSNTFAYIEPAC